MCVCVCVCVCCFVLCVVCVCVCVCVCCVLCVCVCVCVQYVSMYVTGEEIRNKGVRPLIKELFLTAFFSFLLTSVSPFLPASSCVCCDSLPSGNTVRHINIL